MPEAHVSQEKKDVVKAFADLILEYPIVGAVNMESLPAPQLQKMRSNLRERGVVLKMAKRRLIKLAIASVKDKKKGIEVLEEHLRGMPALLFAKDNPFALNKILQKSKSKAPAKAGQTAPNEIIVPAGPTPFAPGPVIGELGACGIKAGVEGGKVAVKEDSVVAKPGDVITAEAAAILTRLGIEPMEIGLDMIAAYEGGLIYGKDVLNIDEQEYLDNLTKAHRWSFNLAMEAGIPTKETVEVMLQKAAQQSKALALEANVLTSDTVQDVLAKANAQAIALKNQTS
jgi:large subunit ribosomal protein L10